LEWARASGVWTWVRESGSGFLQTNRRGVLLLKKSRRADSLRRVFINAATLFCASAQAVKKQVQGYNLKKYSLIR
jgi:hypothetical protein